MASYADYTYYTGTFHGSTIASTEFANLAIRASAAIDQATFGRAASVITADDPAETVTAIQMATCAVADDLKGFETAQDGITSERVGSHSVTYNEKSKMTKSYDEITQETIELYLGNTGLLCRWA